ncbi:MAG: hypothetical protein RMK57_03485 [Bryobacterales bacterium]|nr:hypothetical protein [Bryobacteraceae bacterium]MDW8353571.1 hypothetical protein [Bryobacterales bacterium]
MLFRGDGGVAPPAEVRLCGLARLCYRTLSLYARGASMLAHCDDCGRRVPTGASVAMRWLLTPRVPRARRLVVVESGSRHLIEAILPYLYRTFGGTVAVDVVTCYGGLPSGLHPETATAWRIHEYRGGQGLRRLVAALRSRHPEALVMLCSGEPIMTKWKWALALLLPVKVLIVNENADYFWLDRTNWRTVCEFLAVRSGLTGAAAVTGMLRLLVFPFTLVYLLLYAAALHLRRKVIS